MNRKKRSTATLLLQRKALRADGIVQTTLYLDEPEGWFLRQLGEALKVPWHSVAKRVDSRGRRADPATLLQLLALAKNLSAPGGILAAPPASSRDDQSPQERAPAAPTMQQGVFL